MTGTSIPAAILAATPTACPAPWRVAIAGASGRMGRMLIEAVQASDDSMGQWWKGRYTLAEFHERLKVVPDCRTAVVQDAGHMLHHDQPQAVAALIEHFLWDKKH